MDTKIKYEAIKIASELVELYNNPPNISITANLDYLTIFGEKFDFAIIITEELLCRQRIYLFDVIDLPLNQLHPKFDQYFKVIGSQFIVQTNILGDQAKICIRSKRYDRQIIDEIEYYYEALGTKNFYQSIYSKIAKS